MIWDLIEWRITQSLCTLQESQKNEIKGKEISKEKEMQEERLAETETEEKSKGRMNSIILVEEIKGNEFLEELGHADMMEGLEDIEGWDDLEAFNEFGEELELGKKKKNPVIWNEM